MLNKAGKAELVRILDHYKSLVISGAVTGGSMTHSRDPLSRKRTTTISLQVNEELTLCRRKQEEFGAD